MVGGILCPTPTGRKCLFVNIQMLEKIKTILSCTSLYYGSIYRWTDMKLENDVIGNGITENSGEDHKSIRKRVGGSLFRSRTVKTPVLSNIPPSSLKRFIPRKQLQTDIDTTHTRTQRLRCFGGHLFKIHSAGICYVSHYYQEQPLVRWDKQGEIQSPFSGLNILSS